jgi:hypothetical protein
VSSLVRQRATAKELDDNVVLPVPRLLSVAKTAGILGRSPRTVRRRIEKRELPAVIVHGRTMVRSDELRAYIEALDRPGGRAAPWHRSRSTNGRFDFLRD